MNVLMKITTVDFSDENLRKIYRETTQLNYPKRVGWLLIGAELSIVHYLVKSNKRKNVHRHSAPKGS